MFFRKMQCANCTYISSSMFTHKIEQYDTFRCHCGAVSVFVNGRWQLWQTIPSDHFAKFLAANIDNAQLNDKDFRELVRNSLQIVVGANYGRPK